MKAWLDEVFDDDLLGTAGDRLAGKELGLVVNTGRALKDFAPGQGQSFTLAELLRPLQALANETKMTYLTPLVVGQFAYLTERERQELLVNYRQYLTGTPARALSRPGGLVSKPPAEVG